MELEKLAGLVCPECGGALEYGFYSRALDPLALVSARKYQDYLCRYAIAEKTCLVECVVAASRPLQNLQNRVVCL